MSRPVTVPALQLGPTPDDDKVRAAARMLRPLDQAAARGAEVVAFPELALTSYFCGRPRTGSPRDARHFDSWPPTGGRSSAGADPHPGPGPRAGRAAGDPARVLGAWKTHHAPRWLRLVDCAVGREGSKRGISPRREGGHEVQPIDGPPSGAGGSTGDRPQWYIGEARKSLAGYDEIREIEERLGEVEYLKSLAA